MECEIRHREKKGDTAMLIIKGKPKRTIFRYMKFLSEIRTRELQELWGRLP